MKTLLYDPTSIDPTSKSRGGGRFVSLLKDYLKDEVALIDSFSKVSDEDILIVPFFNLFQKPILSKLIARKQIIVIYDVIPLKYRSHFPVGIKGNINVFLNKQSLKYFDVVVTISEIAKKDIHTYLNVPLEKIIVIYPTLGSKLKVNNLIHKSSSLIPHSYCMYVGDVNWNKNITNIAKAIKIADVSCVFVGKAFETVKKLHETQVFHPWQSELKSFIHEIDTKRFIFPGYISDEELNELYRNASINILISRDEGFGFSYLEASKQNCPSLLSDTPIFHEIAQDAALFVDQENPEEVADKIKLLMKNEELRIDLQKKAQKRAEFFNIEKFKEEWLQIISR